MYPQLVIDLKKLQENTKVLVDKCKAQGISVMGVTKVFCADEKSAQAYVDGGVDYLADSRIENLERLQFFAPKKVLLRLPMISEAARVVEAADITLNSEVATIKAINQAASAKGLVHEIILMIDLGDLREGIMPVDFEATVSEITALENIQLIGVGVNLTCYGGVVPNADNLGQISAFARRLESEYGLTLDIVSGGNSSSLYLLDRDGLPKGINNLRLGEALVLGRETAFGDAIENTHQDAFQLVAEIIEMKEKPTLPIGEIGMDAFGNKPVFEDEGIKTRAILAVGRQDVNVDNIIPVDSRIRIFGASSDHLIVDLTEVANDYKVGDTVTFNLEYGGLLSLATSPYVKRVYK
ncbi:MULTISPECIES: ornithine racemase Orr [unclassified Fusibacter]|uniref:ornithine racemase Orr n=1 Tax=unclassified Fusibacter TaxID=2624464 RepID=UPI001010B6C4|nr:MULTISPECIES: ornithine racemase Orr [unclassified Fusibacter]MCK8059017.1 ornithine racemase Orr [Fusibacter sp. A2]NPE22428.1 alanine/ornithine racemase family PLP-dependent enzyme [Fusibacter sp. A1]RXV60533.1 alanine/ornithine racemase family PLP-dependent enzyme [Fusibacter sp. A1]